MTTQTVNPGVVMFVVVRCVACNKPQDIEAPYGVTIRFNCTSRQCRGGRWQTVTVR